MGCPQNDSFSLDLSQPDVWVWEPEPTEATQVFIWLALLLTFGLQFYLAVFCLLKCWSYDTRLKQALKNLPSTGKLPTTGNVNNTCIPDVSVPSSIIQLPEDLKSVKPPAYCRYDVEVAESSLPRPSCYDDEEARPCTNSPYTPFAWDLVQR
ncbi:unnamed protein product [Coregonus sp. 'balchen']|nr:unnamed protein product [Coregonus sp. 'balchen']